MKFINQPQKSETTISKVEKHRRKREGIIIIIILIIVVLLTFVENRVIHFGSDFPVSNTILMFIIININLLLLILLLFLVFRNLFKLLYDRKRNVMGAKLRTRLVIAFIALTLMPTTILFFFSISFITNSIEFWFNAPVEQALENSLNVGRSIYSQAEKDNRFFLDRIAFQITKKKLLKPANHKALVRYVNVVQRAFNLDSVEVYSVNSKRLAMAIMPELENQYLEPVPTANLQINQNSKDIRTVSNFVMAGELFRTIGTVPFGVTNDKVNAFVAVSILISPELSADMASISRGFEEYQQIKLLKEPIQLTYYITLSIVALLVLFCAVWFGFHLAQTITIPIMALAKGTRRVAEGDLSFSIDIVADDAIGSLVDSFNKMTKDLRIGREQLDLSSRQLREQNVEIEARRRYMEIVLKNVSAGVITLDAKGVITTFNKSAENMLSIKAENILDNNYKNVLTGPLLNLSAEIMNNISSTREDAAEIPLHLTIDGRPRTYLAYINSLMDDLGQHMGIVMVVDDLTELEKAQRMAAWREVARRIAHEVKNPLTPISLSAQRLIRRYSKQLNEPVFDECTRMIIDHVELIRNLVNEFSTFAKFPTADPKPCDLVSIIEETIVLYREAHPNIEFGINIADIIPTLNLDRRQIKQAMINLVDNAVASIRKEGFIKISLSHDSILKQVRIEVEDNGSGISDDDKTRLFEPNFSTKTAGMGLGLTIVSSIIADHNGIIGVQDNHPKGARFVIELPVS